MRYDHHFRLNAVFYLSYLLLLAGVGWFQLLFSQADISLWVNQHHHPVADIFFKYFTHLGDGAFCIALGVICFFFSRLKGRLLILAYALSGVLAQILKRFAFPDRPRPAAYFAEILPQIHTVAGVELAHWHSFPSGHTTSAFAVFGFLAFQVSTTWAKVGLLLVAVLVGYSRLYLFQHFLVDVYFGSILGITIAWGIENRGEFRQILKKLFSKA
ncbi:MAG: phosphatase PAP2 family protein [Runella sp.]